MTWQNRDHRRTGGGVTVRSLHCIRCGACLNTCPVFRVAGGHSYGWVYPGPIGAIVSTLLLGLENATPLPYASSLCGACKEACPVNIDIRRVCELTNSYGTEKDSCAA